MSIRLGANPIIWSNDDMPELGAEISLETCLAQARRIGFAGMELGHKFPRQPAQLAAALEPFGLACVSGWYSARLLERDVPAELASLRAHLELLKAMAASVLVLAEVSSSIHGARHTPLSQRPRLAEAQWAGFGARLTELARLTQSEGVRVAYHHHMGTVVQSESDIERLMAATGPEVGLLLDTGHAHFAGADPQLLARRYAQRICHVHAKDVRAPVLARVGAADLSFLDAVLAGVFTVPGDGCIDFAGVFTELRGYSGWVVLEAEQDPRRADPLTYATRGFEHLERLLAPRRA